ncbi:Lipase 4 [Fusarium odoratissimum]|uniref:Carboxylic ester hydrolase n=2 Tax=Fusarium oxysporum f. sp. cubense (strain race 4) TaxID=2502994 RepID=N1RJR7_FUSC4|nr:uncharacterized protein FOIG_16784 [Fusarium odoratissimum NRRL 54006]EMT66823.1 Lipase 4 [Fusarium odoratissimum]EXL89935.1 hypothetical protein FOIG_16784 [Fusarium odoratissimum NRRL 54006]
MKQFPLLQSILVACAVPTALGAPARACSPTARIHNGTVQGLYNQEFHQDFFLGMPYAQPPEGNLRFRRPVSINETWSTALNATAYGNHCINNPVAFSLNPTGVTYPEGEDCLSVNVVRPSGTTDRSNLPVLIWIHGGGFQEGGSGDGRYNMSYLVRNSVEMGYPTVMVSFNYRLNGWGFLAGQEVEGAGLLNLGLLDQRLALQWVQENIRAFGGDPHKVTIQGESAGGSSVGFHLMAYGGRDDKLFRAAIIESSSPLNVQTFATPTERQVHYDRIVNDTGCTGAVDTLGCLREAPFDKIKSALSTHWLDPVLDGTFIQGFRTIGLREGSFVKVPLLIGTNTDEGRLFVGNGVNTTDEFRNYVANTSIFGVPKSEESVDLVLDFYPTEIDETDYPPQFGAQYGRVQQYITDFSFTSGKRFSARRWSDFSQPVYTYRFNTLPNGFDLGSVGVTHFLEVAFVFNNVPGTGMSVSSFDVSPPARKQQYLQLGQLMSRMWLSFANTLDPNNHKVPSVNVSWPQWTPAEPRNIVFDGNLTSIAYIEKDDWREEAVNMLIDRALDWGR